MKNLAIILSDNFGCSTHLIKKTEQITGCSAISFTVYTEPHILQLHIFVFKIGKILTDQRTGIQNVAIRPIAVFATNQAELHIG